MWGWHSPSPSRQLQPPAPTASTHLRPVVARLGAAPSGGPQETGVKAEERDHVSGLTTLQAQVERAGGEEDA